MMMMQTVVMLMMMKSVKEYLRIDTCEYLRCTFAASISATKVLPKPLQLQPYRKPEAEGAAKKLPAPP